MSLILKGIDLPNSGQIEIIIRPHGKVLSKTRGISAEAIQIPKGHGRLKDFDGDGIHPIIIDGVYMIKVDDLDEMPTILGWEENDEYNT